MTMIRESIDISCLQDTHRSLSDSFISDEDFLIILSGGSNNDREYAGVGFLIAPHIRKSILGFCQKSNRMCCLKLRISGGKVAIFSTYAPHADKPYNERQQFFNSLMEFWQSVSVNGPRIICGDLNSRLYFRQDTEDCIGPFYFSNPCPQIHSEMTRQDSVHAPRAHGPQAESEKFFFYNKKMINIFRMSSCQNFP